MEITRRRIHWKTLIVITVSLIAVFLTGLYAGTTPLMRGIFPAGSNSSSNGSSLIQPVSKWILTNATINVPALPYTSVTVGNLSTVGYKTVTVSIYMRATTCGSGPSSFTFNGYWKPDSTSPVYFSNGLDPINLSNAPGAITRNASVTGGVLVLVIVSLSNSPCLISGLWLSVYLQP